MKYAFISKVRARPFVMSVNVPLVGTAPVPPLWGHGHTCHLAARVTFQLLFHHTPLLV